jgi:hypothetical protein
MDLEEVRWEAWTGFVWLTMGTGGGRVWMWQWNFGFPDKFLISWETVSFSRRTLQHGDRQSVIPLHDFSNISRFSQYDSRQQQGSLEYPKSPWKFRDLRV